MISLLKIEYFKKQILQSVKLRLYNKNIWKVLKILIIYSIIVFNKPVSKNLTNKKEL